MSPTAPSNSCRRMVVRLALLGAATMVASYARAEDAYVEGEVLVTFKPEVQEPRARAALKDRTLGLTNYFDRISKRRQRVSGLVRNTGRTTAQLLADLKADPTVESVEPNYLRRFSALIPSDPGFSKLWGLRNTGQRVNSVTGVSGMDVRFGDAWALARPSAAEVVVGVVDSGVDISHPDLAGNIWTNPLEIEGNAIDDDANGFVDDIHGYDFARDSASLSDSGEHGTHVAGTIAAVGENGLGMIGVQFRSKLLPLKVSNDGDSMATSAILDAFDYAIALKERGVNVVALNASFGGSSFSNAEKAAIDALGSAGIILCAAAGNDGISNEATPVYPANYAAPNIIVIAALDQSGELAGYSNFGATTVDLAAPGSNIYSTLPLERASHSTAFKVGSLSYSAVALEYSGQTSLAGTTAPIVPCGLGRPEDFPASTAGSIALIGRGTLNFSDKVRNAMNAGAVAVVIYDNTTSVNQWIDLDIGRRRKLDSCGRHHPNERPDTSGVRASFKRHCHPPPRCRRRLPISRRDLHGRPARHRSRRLCRLEFPRRNDGQPHQPPARQCDHAPHSVRQGADRWHPQPPQNRRHRQRLAPRLVGT